MKNTRLGPLLMIFIWTLGTLFLWGLAFFPTTQNSAAWIHVARTVCFGTLENGLPDPSGWLLLILGPISFLIVGFVIWRKELICVFRTGLKTTFGRSFSLALLLAVVVQAGWVSEKLQAASDINNFDFSNPSREDLPSHYPRTDKLASDFSLVDQAGEKIQLLQMKEDIVILTFAFAHCQTVCPVLVQDALDTTKELGVKNLKVLIVTLDPWRDTPQALPYLAKKWELPENAHVLSGAIDQVITTLKDYDVPHSRNEQNGDITHPALIYVIEPGGNIAYTLNNVPRHWLAQAIQRIGGVNAMAPSVSR